MSSDSQFDVKPESSSAAGTLLITWLASTDTITSRPSRAEAISARKPSSRPRFPMKMKNAANVSSSE